MKKIVFLILMACIAVLTGYSQTGVIREFTGDVGLKTQGATDFIPAEAGALVAQDTIISTGFKSTAIIAVGSATITVRPLTRLSLAEIQSSQSIEALNVNLQAGRVRVDVKPPAGTKANAVVQTPSATASSRGTEFEVDRRSVSTFQGKVVVQGANGLAQIVSAGFRTEATADGGLLNPADLAEETLTPLPPEGFGLAGEQMRTSTPTTGNIAVNINLN
ncbi:MAG: FecR family protein [Treponema sp.]|jgi:hypothetical protein|nr:FecR family protein [Treponema sp.]